MLIKLISQIFLKFEMKILNFKFDIQVIKTGCENQLLLIWGIWHIWELVD
jgi:hypothetical protein